MSELGPLTDSGTAKNDVDGCRHRLSGETPNSRLRCNESLDHFVSAAKRSFTCISPSLGATFFEGSGKPGAGLRARAKVGGKNERLREHRLSHFRLQTRRERNWGGRFIGTFPIRGLGEGCFSALSIPCSGGWRLTSVRWDVTVSTTAAKTISKADVEAILAKLADDQDEDYDWKRSIVDLMKLLKLDSGLGARKQLAQELGYTGALDGSAEMNVWLHKQVMTKLAESGGKVPDSLKA